MASLQPRLHLKVSQRQVLTPSLVQMVSVLALNKLELREMINAEIVENPILEEMDENVPMLDEVAQGQDVPAEAAPAEGEKADPFEEIDFGSYFQDYLDPGYRTHGSTEVLELPAFENFLSQSGTLADHLRWQLGSMSLSKAERAAAEMIVGNLDGDGYLTASREELLTSLEDEPLLRGEDAAALLERVLHSVQMLDPTGVAARDLRECLLAQIAMAQHLARPAVPGAPLATEEDDLDLAAEAAEAAPVAESDEAPAPCPLTAIYSDAQRIVADHLDLLQKRDLRDLSRAMRRPAEALTEAVAFIRTLDPRPGRRYNREEARLIEPDVAIVKRDDGYVSMLNDDDLPSLRLNHGYRRLLTQNGTERDVRNYIKERYKSAIQLMRNIEQRKTTILRVCDIIIRRQREFFEKGVEALHPMMIKDVAEEIGVHPSTVSRAVSNKYVHTPQGVFELRFFFTEGVNGPEGGDTPLLLLKRRVKKIIEAENPGEPLTDDAIAKMLQTSGIQVTRRTVAKYREDLHIPSTHQRRVRKPTAQTT
jgi:RNA polymerase sigma-54 factor